MNEFLNKIIEELESLVDNSGQFKKFHNSDSAPLSILSIADVIKSNLRTEEEHQVRQMLQRRETDRILNETSSIVHLRNCAS